MITGEGTIGAGRSGRPSKGAAKQLVGPRRAASSNSPENVSSIAVDRAMVRPITPDRPKSARSSPRHRARMMSAKAMRPPIRDIPAPSLRDSARTSSAAACRCPSIRSAARSAASRPRRIKPRQDAQHDRHEGRWQHCEHRRGDDESGGTADVGRRSPPLASIALLRKLCNYIWRISGKNAIYVRKTSADANPLHSFAGSKEHRKVHMDSKPVS